MNHFVVQECVRTIATWQELLN